jgi:hypothetical protein
VQTLQRIKRCCGNSCQKVGKLQSGKKRGIFFAHIYDVCFNVLFDGNYENCIDCLLSCYFTVLFQLIIS